MYQEHQNVKGFVFHIVYYRHTNINIKDVVYFKVVYTCDQQHLSCFGSPPSYLMSTDACKPSLLVLSTEDTPGIVCCGNILY